MHLRAIRMPVLMLALLALTIGGCGKPTTNNPPSGGAPNAATVEKDFVLQKASGEPREGRPSIVLAFSQKLVGTQPFDQLLTITDSKGAAVSGSWVLDGEGRELHFPYLKGDENYKLSIKPELAAVDGRTIGKLADQVINSGPAEPLLGFASQGSVLPAYETRGLPVVSLNAAEADLEFFRVREKDVSRFLANYQKNGRRSYWSLQQVAQYADSVYSNRYALDNKKNDRTLSYLPVRDVEELKPAGLYFAVMKRPGDFATDFDTAMFFVSDLGLSVRAYHEQLLVHVASLESGNAISGVKLSLRNERSEILASAETDAEGLATFAARPKATMVLVAERGRDVSLLPFNQPALDLSEFAIAGRPQRGVEIFPWSGRDLYRPGETLRVAALLRDQDGKALPPQPIFAVLKQADGHALITRRIEPGELGYAEFEYAIPKDAATGKWTVGFGTNPAAIDDGSAFVFHVEEFLPERLKLDLSTPGKQLAAKESLKLAVQADYLYGAPASGNRLSAKLALANDQHPIEKLPDFFFGDALAELPKEPKDVIDENLDDQGHLDHELELLESAPTGPVAALLTASVYESGGRAVNRAIKRTIWPAAQLVGVRPLFDLKEGASPDARVGFEVLRADADAALLAASELKVRVVHEIRDYNWSYVQNIGWKSDFVARFETLDERKLALTAGQRGKLEFDLSWGRYRLEIDDPETRLTMRLPFEVGWGFDDNRGPASRPDKVKIALDKGSYKAGETVKVTLNPPHPGPALLLLEGDGLLWHKQLDVRAGTVVEIPLDAGWNRHDLYLTALVFRPGSSSDRITPNRAVGIAAIALDRGDRRNTAQVTAVETMRPNNTLKVSVKASAFAGQQAQVRITAVDLGVLNITQYPLPDASDWFFAQRRLGVDAYDLYGRVIESMDGGRAHLRYGGDAMLRALAQANRPDPEVQTVDLFHAPVALDAKGEASVDIAVPEFNGTLKLRALVFAADRYAAAEGQTIVRAPVVLEASTPRILAPGDQSQLTLDVRNLSGAAGKFHLAFSASGPVTLDRNDADLALNDQQKQSVSIPLKASGNFGTAEISARLTGGGNSLERKFHIAVRPAWPAVHRVESKVLEQAGTLAPSANLGAGLIAESLNGQISVSTLPPLPFSGAVKDLIEYPYGCIEQTSSRAYPLIWLDDETADHLGLKRMPAAQRTAILDATFAKLSAMQLDTGHFASWPGSDSSNTLMTPYVVELLQNAKDAGFAIPESVLNKALDRINEELLSGGNPHYDSEDADHLRVAEMAYGAYVLARAGRVPLGTLRALFDGEREKLKSPLPMAQLGLALALAGDQPRADKALDEAFSKDFQRPKYLGDYGSDLRDLALTSALLHEQKKSKPAYDEHLLQLAREISARRAPAATSWWLSTQEQVAMFRLGRVLLKDGPRSFDGAFDIGGKSSSFDATAMLARQVSGSDLAAGVRVVTHGEGPFYASFDAAGYTREAPAESGTAQLRVKRSWHRPDGSDYDNVALKQGEVLIAHVTVESGENMPDALLVDLLPGGLEVENFNLTDATQWEKVVIDGIALSDRNSGSSIEHEEFRDDRYVAALKLYAGNKAHVFYLVRAVTPGRFVAPPPYAEDMYRPQLRAIGTANPAQFVVVQPQ